MRNYAAQSDPALNPQFRRRWTEVPQCEADETRGVADRLSNEIGLQALQHWLDQAKTSTGTDRQAALRIALEIANMVGVDLSKVVDRKEAA